jgi:hypothetical protein
MKHTPMSDEELAKQGLLEPGIYDFEVASAEDKVSSKGNDMIELKLNVYDADGSIRPIRDWIMPQMAKKFKHFHNACGMMDKYDSGSLVASDVVGKAGKCMVIQKPYTNKDGLNLVSNGIDDYVKRDNLEVYAKASTKSVADTLEGDDIPF